MTPLTLTEDQQRAVRVTGRSALVSASAGSGKTRVLAERCVYLICDAPPGERCSLDQLLVLTFTDAAASEMRARIESAIRQRAERGPDQARLREQLARIESSQISTIHSFCLWMNRRWFHELGIDPLARIMDEEETKLLKRTVLDELFQSQYPENASFRKLVDDYGLGHDRTIGQFVLKLYSDSESMPDTEGWLRHAVASLTDGAERTVALHSIDLWKELRLQVEECERMAAAIVEDDPIIAYYAERIRLYARQVREWFEQLGERAGADSADGQSVQSVSTDLLGADKTDALLKRFDEVGKQIRDFRFEAARPPRMGKDVSPEITERVDRVKKSYVRTRENYFRKRLQERFALYTSDECIQVLRQTAPYWATLTDLVRHFRANYGARKLALGQLDFADLERNAYQLLRADDGDAVTDVGRYVQQRFQYVLVDEVQDINPLQYEIIQRVSRELDDDAPDNLFCVGDVKQSIYGFRLAEPELFVERMRRFRSETSRGELIGLQANFRSCPEILEAVNHVFRSVTACGEAGIDYDSLAEMYPGQAEQQDRKRTSIELHILERPGRSHDGEDNDDESDTPLPPSHDPLHWSAIQREAFLIGQRIREWGKGNEGHANDGAANYGEIVVLLRSHRAQADQMARMLQSMGIPTIAEAGGSLLETREVRDVIAALQVLDNMQQDIPLASVLRSGVFGDRFTADELARIRLVNRGDRFFDAVCEYVDRGDDKSLRTRLGNVVDRMQKYRSQAQRRPVAEILWRIYEDEGFLTYVQGLPEGTRRGANLEKLKEIARTFDKRYGCGLHRFLGFVQQMTNEEQSIDVPPSAGDSRNAVRIMSVHKSKGMEFPIVFLAGLGNRMNLGDRNGRMIADRRGGFGLRAVDTQRMVEFPSVAHARVASEIENVTRQEELRILYVAMTRACDRLILVGSSRRSFNEDGYGAKDADALSAFQFLSASSPLDWLVPVILGSPLCTKAGGEQHRAGDALFEAHCHSMDHMRQWRVDGAARSEAASVRQAVARLEPLPPSDSIVVDTASVDEISTRLEFTYPHLESTALRSSLAASESKRLYEIYAGLEEAASSPSDNGFTVPPSRYGGVERTAAHRGIVTHTVLQHLDYGVACDAAGLASELQRLQSDGFVLPEDVELLDTNGIGWFLSTPLAKRIGEAGEQYRREFPFTAGEPAARLEPSIDSEDDYVLVRGMVDGILSFDDGLEIVDFKTDSIAPEDVMEGFEKHRPQMELYAKAMAQCWRRPVRQCWLVFLTPCKMVSWNGTDKAVVS